MICLKHPGLGSFGEFGVSEQEKFQSSCERARSRPFRAKGDVCPMRYGACIGKNAAILSTERTVFLLAEAPVFQAFMETHGQDEPRDHAIRR